MKTPRFAIVLTGVNILVLMFTLFRTNSVATPDVAPVLRGRALEIVDNNGQVRAEIKVLPAQPDFKMPDGSTGYPETVQLRLIDSGRGHVKLAAMEDGSGLVLGGESGGYAQILSRGTNLPFIKIVTKDGREQVMKPQ